MHIKQCIFAQFSVHSIETLLISREFLQIVQAKGYGIHIATLTGVGSKILARSDGDIFARSPLFPTLM